MAHQRKASDEEDGGEGDPGCQNSKKDIPPSGETGKCAVGSGIANVLKGSDTFGS